MQAAYTYDARVLRVIDGDTIDVEVDCGFRMLARQPLRIAHVDAAERYTELGKAATAYLSALLMGSDKRVVVRTVKPVEKYGRYLADVFVDDVDVGALLIELGFAVAYEGGTR